MEVEVEPLLFDLKGNDAVFANGATYDTGSIGSKIRFKEFISKKNFLTTFLKTITVFEPSLVPLSNMISL